MPVLTFFSNDRQCDRGAGIFDQLNDAIMGQLDDGLPVHRRDLIADLEFSAALSRASFYDAANFMRNDWGETPGLSIT